MNASPGADRLRPWWTAIRPHTLPAGASPVIMGTALAWRDGRFAALPALAALVGALLLQIGTNLANDYFDAQSGVDEHRTAGFTRVTQSGLLPPRHVLRAMQGTFLLAVVGPGLYLVWLGGVPILVLGLLGVLFGVIYAGGPLPIGSIALGDLLVFVFFGLAAVGGTYYVQSVFRLADPFPGWIPPGTLPSYVGVAGLPAAGLTTAILAVNNLRDLETDRRAGKYTLAVLLGETGTRIEYLLLLVVAYGSLLWLWWDYGFGPGILLPLISLPAGLKCVRDVFRYSGGKALNNTLSSTGRLLFLFSLLFVGGVLL